MREGESAKRATLLTDMLRLIDSYIAGDVGLALLVRGLRQRYAALECNDEEWSSDFMSAWGGLETVNALVLSEREIRNSPKIEPSVEQQRLIQSYIKEMRRLIAREPN